MRIHHFHKYRYLLAFHVLRGTDVLQNHNERRLVDFSWLLGACAKLALI